MRCHSDCRSGVSAWTAPAPPAAFTLTIATLSTLGGCGSASARLRSNASLPHLPCPRRRLAVQRSCATAAGAPPSPAPFAPRHERRRPPPVAAQPSPPQPASPSPPSRPLRLRCTSCLSPRHPLSYALRRPRPSKRWLWPRGVYSTALPRSPQRRPSASVQVAPALLQPRDPDSDDEADSRPNPGTRRQVGKGRGGGSAAQLRLEVRPSDDVGPIGCSSAPSLPGKCTLALHHAP